MADKIYVGNLAYAVTRDDLQNFFAEFGAIANISIPQDRETGRARGFAFIQFEDAASAEKSLQKDGQDLLGRNIRVNIAKEREPRSGGGCHRGGQRRNERFYED